jgi:translation initiation factor 1
MASKKNKVVYSTSRGDQRKQTTVSSAPRSSLPPEKQDLRILRDKKGRKGKMVTVITGFALTEADIATLAKTLKTLCGAGGTFKSEAGQQVVEVQGDHREKVAEQLKSMGYKVKFSGG